MTDTPDAPKPPAEQPALPARNHKWRRRLIWVGIGAGVFVFLFASVAVTMEYYTSQPQFCGSCHVMQPYYVSWENDPHAHQDIASCVDCHYAPGEQHTLMAKFKGLSQLASYFTGRYGHARPRAHVSDDSCLSCHAPETFMYQELRLGTVTFVHDKHLGEEGKIATETRQEAAELRRRLVAQLGAAGVAALEDIARPMQHADVRNRQLIEWLNGQDVEDVQDDVLAYGEVLHTLVRVDHLLGLKCSSCHEFDPTLNTHFTIARNTCYTCHFIHQPFNENTARCLSCHDAPTGVVAIHQPGAGPQQVAPVTMDHATIIANNVNCISCHADVVHGTGQVTRRDCQTCHDQERYLRDFDNLTVEVVQAYHRDHAARQRARCNDCHRTIEHELKPLEVLADAASILNPVRQDCLHCHPNHHQAQVDLLLGRGGAAEIAGVANPMVGSRINCRGCHTEPGADPGGEAVIRSTLESCRSCHTDEYEQLFFQWHHAIAARLQEAQDLLARAEQRVAAEDPGPQVRQRLDRARHDINFVNTANGIHNRHYALSLLDHAIVDLEALLRDLNTNP